MTKDSRYEEYVCRREGRKLGKRSVIEMLPPKKTKQKRENNDFSVLKEGRS